jgi:hypothetical protein
MCQFLQAVALKYIKSLIRIPAEYCFFMEHTNGSSSILHASKIIYNLLEDSFKAENLNNG